MPRSTAPVLPIRVEGFTKTFGRRRLWSDVDLEIGAGELLALIGPSGSGKTTLLNCIGLLERVDEGSISFGEHRLTADSGRERRLLYRDSLGFLFQNSGLVDDWTVEENVAIALPRRRATGALRSRQVGDVLHRLEIGDLAREKAHTLSGGERQRTGLARLLLKRASVVLVDEPTASLDDDNARMVTAVLRELADEGAAVIVSTHDDRVRASSDRELTLRGGAQGA